MSETTKTAVEAARAAADEMLASRLDVEQFRRSATKLYGALSAVLSAAPASDEEVEQTTEWEAYQLAAQATVAKAGDGFVPDDLFVRRDDAVRALLAAVSARATAAERERIAVYFDGLHMDVASSSAAAAVRALRKGTP